MLPKHVVEAMGLDEFSKKPVGTGPYQFVDWVKDSQVTLKANQNWWGGKPIYDEVVFRFIPDATTRQADLMSGTIDLMQGLSPDLVTTIEARSDLEVVSVPGLRCMSIFFNPHIKPLDDVRVRQAINYAIDKKQLIDLVLGGYAIPSYEQLSEGDFGYTLEGINKYEYDPAKAKELLTQAGYPKGFTLDLQLGRRWSKDLELMEAIQSMLAEVGITLNIVPMEWGTYLSQYHSTGKMTAGFFGFSNMIGDGDLPLFYYYSSGSMGKLYTGSDDLDKLIAAEEAELDPAKREGILNEIIRMGNANADRVELFRYNDLWGQKKGLEWFPRSDTRVLLYTLDGQ
jgi:peptide/nickel transport system substrate-binding protein